MLNDNIGVKLNIKQIRISIDFTLFNENTISDSSADYLTVLVLRIII